MISNRFIYLATNHICLLLSINKFIDTLFQGVFAVFHTLFQGIFATFHTLFQGIFATKRTLFQGVHAAKVQKYLS